MPAKTTGAEFKQFYQDAAFWPDGAWHDDDVIYVDGVEQSDIDVETILDNAYVVIESGVVFLPGGDADGIKFDAYFRRWLKSQKTRRIGVECDVEKLEQVIASVKAAGGKVTI